ncbi:MAG: SRPBCC family protein [Bacteroidales bacterium]|nr:SRPBCC family protein [Bacteroidales bacterium]
MKVLKKIGIVIVALLVLLLVVAVSLPKSINVESSVLIDMPVDSVFEQVVYLKNMEAWSPWKDYDPEMKISYSGTDGAVGAVYSWEGNKDVGSGSQEITNIVPNARIDLKLAFVAPWESESDVYFTFNDKGASTEVLWGFVQETLVPTNLMMTIMNVDKSLKKEFDKGLSRLKAKCES